MKKIIFEILTIGVLFLASSSIAADKAVIDADENIVTALVIDCGDVGHTTWKRSLILARQAISLLKAGDELILITAHKCRNAIETSCCIDPNNATQQTMLNRKLMALEYQWWCRARIADALQLAYGELNNRPSGHKCCIVISDGSYNNSEVEDIRRKTAVYRLSGISLLMTVTGTANQNLLLAGNQKELDVAVLEQADLAGWFNRVRPHRDISAAAITPQPAAPLPGLPTLPSSLSPKPPPRDKKNVSPSFIAPAKPEINKPSIRSQPPPVTKPKRNYWGTGFAFLIALVLGVVLVSIVVAKAKSASSLNNIDHSTEEGHSIEHLIATKDNERCDLGELVSNSDFVFGSISSSPILLNGENVLPEEFKFSIINHGFKLKNLSDVVLSVNLMPLEPGKSIEIILPVTVTSEKGFSIGLFCEPIEGINNEGEAEHGKE